MYPFKLKSEVIIKGSNFFGRKAEITFFPMEKDLRWWWEYYKHAFIPIGPEIVDCRNRRLRLFFENKTLEIYEHIGLLRWFGLLGVMISGSGWPPYYGRSIEFWHAIKPFCIGDESQEITWYKLETSGPIYWIYPNTRAGHRSFTAIFPTSEKRLLLEISVDYPGLGEQRMCFSLPDKETLEKICAAHNQGWPPYLYYLSKIGGLFGWPHHRTAVWPQKHQKEETLEKFILHRAADLLGALSLLCRDGLFAGRVVSKYSGHQADLEVINMAKNLIYRFD